MKYFSANASIITVRVRKGYWSNSRQAAYLAGKLVWLLDLEDLCTPHNGITVTIRHLITEFLKGSADADRLLRTCITPAGYKVISEVASFMAVDHEGSSASDAYLAIDLNSGRNFVLRPR